MYFVAAVRELQISCFSNVKPNFIKRSCNVLTLSFVVFVTNRTFTLAARSLQKGSFEVVFFSKILKRVFFYLSKADTAFPTALSSTCTVPLKSIRAPSILPESVLDIIILDNSLEQSLNEMAFNSMNLFVLCSFTK